MNHESRESGGLQAFDPRECSGICNTQDGVKILYDAPKISGKTRTILHTVIAHHTNDNCVEICCVHVRLNIESPRIYVDYTKLKNTIDPELYNTRLMALKEEIKQQRREYKPQKAALQVSNELVLEYLMRRLHLSEECSEVHGVFMMDLRIVAGDATKVIPHPDDFEVKLTVSDILCEKPRALVPVQLDIDAKLSNLPLRDPAMQVRDFHLLDETHQNERRKSEFNCLRDISVEDLRDSLNDQYNGLHSKAWLQWKQDAGKVMARMVQLPKMKDRLDHSCAADWYAGAMRVRSDNAECAERRRRQDERIQEIANAKVPAKIDHTRACYTKHSEETEMKKKESITKLGNGTKAHDGDIRKVRSEDVTNHTRRKSMTASGTRRSSKTASKGAQPVSTLGSASISSSDNSISGCSSGIVVNGRRSSNRSVSSILLDSDSDDDPMVLHVNKPDHTNHKSGPLKPMLPLFHMDGQELQSITPPPSSAASTGRRTPIEDDLRRTSELLKRRDRSRCNSIKASPRDTKLPSLSPSNETRLFETKSRGSSEPKRRHSHDGLHGSFERQLKAFQRDWAKSETKAKPNRSFILMNEFEKMKSSEPSSDEDSASLTLKDTFGMHAKKLPAHVPLQSFTDARKLKSKSIDSSTTGETIPRRRRSHLSYSSNGRRAGTANHDDEDHSTATDTSLSCKQINALEQKLPNCGPLFSPDSNAESGHHDGDGMFFGANYSSISWEGEQCPLEEDSEGEVSDSEYKVHPVGTKITS